MIISIRRVVCHYCGKKNLMFFFFTSFWRCTHCLLINSVEKKQ